MIRCAGLRVLALRDQPEYINHARYLIGEQICIMFIQAHGETLMIHKLVVINDAGTIGWTLYDDRDISLDNVLLCAFVSALMDFTTEMGSGSTELRSADLGNYKIAVTSHENLAYVAVLDIYDNNAFTAGMIKRVVTQYHE